MSGTVGQGLVRKEADNRRQHALDVHHCRSCDNRARDSEPIMKVQIMPGSGTSSLTLECFRATQTLRTHFAMSAENN